MLSKYNSIDEFCQHYNPDMQLLICFDKRDCFFGQYPTLLMLQDTYKVSASYWLVPQLLDLSQFCGASNKLQGHALEQCAELIAQNYAFLKVSEVMLFFYRFKLGLYGRFYGSVDPIYIMMALRDFVNIDRYKAIEHREQMLYRKQRDEAINASVTYQQYLELKNKQKQ